MLTRSYAELSKEQQRIWDDFNQPPYDDLRKTKIASPEPGTLKWLEASEITSRDQTWPRGSHESQLSREDFIAWRDSRCSGSFLVQAPPGQGKSVLSKFVIDHLERFKPKRKTIYYFCSIHYPEKFQNGAALLRALIVQLCKDRRVFQQLPRSFEEDFQKFASASVPDLWNVLQKALKEGPFRHIYCIIDGLDVYGDRMEDVAGRLKTLFNPEDSGDAGTEPLLKLFCTSRNQDDIDSAFRGSLIRRFLPDDDDIKVFIEKRSTNLKNLNKDQKEIVEKMLRKKAEKTFLWLDVVIRGLKALELPSNTEIKNTITEAPTYLPNLYRLRVNEISKNPKSRRMLVWVVYAREPLGLRALADAVAFGSSDNITRYADCNNSKPHLTADGLRNSLGTLLDVLNERVYLIHQSLKDYFETSKALWPNPDAGLEPRVDIAKICMRYLALEDFTCKKTVQTVCICKYQGDNFTNLRCN